MSARYSKTPAAGLVVLSDHGEPTMLSDEETRQVLRQLSDAAAAEKVMLAGCRATAWLGRWSWRRLRRAGI